MKRIEVTLIAVIIVLSAALIVQYTEGKALVDSSQAAVQGSPNPQETLDSKGLSAQMGTTDPQNYSTLTDLFK